MFDVDTNIDANETVAVTRTVELAFAGVGNFLTGNYKQSDTDIQDIRSNVATVGGGFQRMRTFLISNPSVESAASLSTYGTALSTRGYETQFGTGAVDKMNDEQNNVVLLNTVLESGHGGFIPMPKFNASSPINTANLRLEKGKCSLGDALVNAVGAALFKKVGKNAALINENAMVTAINTKFAASLGAQMNEVNSAYSSSKYFKRYLQSGRYVGSDGDVNSLVDYTMNNTLVKCKLNIYGQVQDQDGASGIDFTKSQNVDQVFGSGGDHNAALNAPHLINSTGIYKISCYLELKHDERF